VTALTELFYVLSISSPLLLASHCSACNTILCIVLIWFCYWKLLT